MNLEDRLWQALEPAAVREAQRSPFAWLRVALPPVRLRSVAGIVILLIALAASAALIAALSRPAPHPATPGPKKVETTGVGAGLGDAAAGFGAVWTYDVAGRRLLRIDPSTRRVVQGVAVPNPYLDMALATGAGALWAVPVHNTGHMSAGTPSRPLALVRFDPANGRRVASVPIRVPGGAPIVPFGLTVATDGVWVWGQTAAVRVDPRSNRVTGAIQVPRDEIKGFAIADGSVWVATEGSRLLRFDARTAERTGALHGRPLMQPIPLIVTPTAIVIDGQNAKLYATDPATGRALWQAHMAGGAHAALASGGRIWVLTTSDTRPTDELVALDPKTGRAISRVGLPTSGGAALQAVGSDLWVTDSDGDIHIVHP
jgi:sugar lactone lactonase YvrE